MKKYFLFFGLILLFVNCKNDKKETQKETTHTAVEFQEISVDSTEIIDCTDQSCPEIEVDYLVFEGEDDFAQTVNAENEKYLINLLHINEDKPKSNTAKKAIEGFVAEYFEVKESFPESNFSYELKVNQAVENEKGKNIVLKTDFYIFTGGAHGYGGTHFMNFDRETGKLLTHEDLIADIPAFTDFVEEAFRRQYEIPAEADINSKGFLFEDGKFILPENIAVKENDVILIYNPYEAASYSEGPLRFLFPKKSVEKWFNY